MVPVTAITMMNAVIASPVQRWSHKILFRNMSCPSGMGVPFDVNETCGKVTGGFATPGSAGRKAKPTRLKTDEFSTLSVGRQFRRAVYARYRVFGGSRSANR